MNTKAVLNSHLLFSVLAPSLHEDRLLDFKDVDVISFIPQVAKLVHQALQSTDLIAVEDDYAFSVSELILALKGLASWSLTAVDVAKSFTSSLAVSLLSVDDISSQKSVCLLLCALGREMSIFGDDDEAILEILRQLQFTSDTSLNSLCLCASFCLGESTSFTGWCLS